jgi:hypothetical protein
MTSGRGRPVALPATSSCMRPGTSTTARASALAARSSRKTSAPPSNPTRPMQR